MNDLAERKQLLVLQADLHRAVLQAELVSVRSRLEQMREVRQKLTRGPWGLVGVATAGFLAVRNWRAALKLVPAAFTAWRWFKKAKSS